MDQNKKQDIALVRYSVIAPLITGLNDEYPSLSAFFASAAEKEYLMPDGRLRRFSPDSIERWYYQYNHGGFNALLPGGRRDCGTSRKLGDEEKSYIDYLRKTYPKMSAAAIYQKLITDGYATKNDLSESTVYRYVRIQKADEKKLPEKDMHRYEREHINEVWCGDSCYGPFIMGEDNKKHRTFIIAMIDDASRFIIGADVFFADNFINLMSVMKSAVLKHGKPKLFNFDNGKSYRNSQMQLLTARIGSSVHYCHPYSPAEKSKIERWFRTLRDKWLACIIPDDFPSIDEFRNSLHAFVYEYNNTKHSSLSGKTPSERFFSEPDFIKRLPVEKIEKSFMLEITRKVSIDNVIVIDNIEYEVPSKFSNQHITLRYSPDMKSIFVVESDDSLTQIRILNKNENSKIKREKIHLSGGAMN